LLAGSGGVDELQKGKISRQQQKAAIRLLPFNNFYGTNELIQGLTNDSPVEAFNSIAIADVKKRR